MRNRSQDEILVASLVEESLSKLRNLHNEISTGKNPFLDAISPVAAQYSSLTRSLTSRLGNGLQKLARELAISKYGADAVPGVVFQSNSKFDISEYSAHAKDTKVISKYDPHILASEASRLMRFAKSNPANRIGTKKFRAEFEKSQDLLQESELADTHELQVDLYVNVPIIGFCEIESGGELDTSNAPAQPAKLIKAALASGQSNVKLHFSLAYANRGEGNPIGGGLPTLFLMQNQSETGDCLFIGKEWWELLLPQGVSHETFLAIFEEVVKNLDIVPQ